jgi:hypothetical protein
MLAFRYLVFSVRRPLDLVARRGDGELLLLLLLRFARRRLRKR